MNDDRREHFCDLRWLNLFDQIIFNRISDLIRLFYIHCIHLDDGSVVETGSSKQIAPYEAAGRQIGCAWSVSLSVCL